MTLIDIFVKSFFQRQECDGRKIIQQAIIFLPLLIFSFIISANAQTDDEVVKVDSSLVVINATVTDTNGKPIRNLKTDQFTVFEDGKPQEISFFAAETAPFAAIILIDTSGSMEERVALARSAAIRFLDGLRTDDFVSIYNFDSKVSLVQDFSNSRDLVDAGYNLKADGMTVLNDAIFKAALDLSNRPEKRRAIIVLSDGADTSSKHPAEKALKAALEANAMIYTVDMAPSDAAGGRERMQSQGALKNFADKSGGKFIATPGGTAMREAFKNIVDELGTQYTLGYQPTTSKDGKWHSIELKTSKPGAQIRTRKGYNSPKK